MPAWISSTSSHRLPRTSRGSTRTATTRSFGARLRRSAFEDRHESTKAYIDYKRLRCVELARVLKKSGSFYYHCDWHASHYVKVMLDQIFGEDSFINEIVWKRSDAKSDVGQGAKHFGRVHDSIFYYAGSDTYTLDRKSVV